MKLAMSGAFCSMWWKYRCAFLWPANYDPACAQGNMEEPASPLGNSLLPRLAPVLDETESVHEIAIFLRSLHLSGPRRSTPDPGGDCGDMANRPAPHAYPAARAF